MHNQQGSFTLADESAVQQAAQDVWSLGGHVRLSADDPMRVDVIAPAGIFPAIRAKLQPTSGVKAEPGNETPQQ